MDPLILLARGSRDPRFAGTVWALTRRVSASMPGQRVKAAFLRHEVPDLRAALAKEAALAHSDVIVVPLLFCDGHYALRAIPTALQAALPSGLPLTVRLAPVLGPAQDARLDTTALSLVVDALRRRLSLAVPASGADAVVLIGPGTRVARAGQSASHVAQALGSSLGVPCRVAYASASSANVVDAFDALRSRGAQRIAAASYHMGPGYLVDRMVWEARRAGAVAITEPLGDCPELAELVRLRAGAAEPVHTGQFLNLG